MNRRRHPLGYTLIEMMAVVAILVALAGVVVSRLMVQQDGMRVRNSIQRLESVASQCRQLAISSGKTYELSFDDTSKQISAKVAETSTSDSPFSGADLSNQQGDNSDEQSATVSKSLGSGWTFSQQTNTLGESENSLSIRFYPDGTAQPIKAQFEAGDMPVALEVSALGAISVFRGQTSESSSQEWEAGDLEQRSN